MSPCNARLPGWFVGIPGKRGSVPAAEGLFGGTGGIGTSSELAVQPPTESGLGFLRMRGNQI